MSEPASTRALDDTDEWIMNLKNTPLRSIEDIRADREPLWVEPVLAFGMLREYPEPFELSPIQPVVRHRAKRERWSMHRLKRVSFALLVVFAVAVGGVAVTGTPAFAAFENCTQANRICTYTDINGGGTLYYYTGPQNTCINIGGGLNDTMSSARNTFGVKVTLYMDAGCINTFWKVDVGVYPCTCRFLYQMPPGMDNSITSIWIGNSPPN